ncbi:MAG: hypothetical protein HY397_02940 [Candidatus Doudnabacteria bacterium]|nr:hypothetical protein [Candidatus Doudnabacteria bacterium]
MSDQDKRPITANYVLEFTNKIILPRVGEIFDEKMVKFRDEILTSNDKLSVKLDKILKEQAAITASYKRLETKIQYLEAVVQVLAEKEGIKFQSPE